MILGLISPAGGGKDTVAHYLKQYGYERVSLADEVRKDMLELVDIPEEYLERYKDKQLRLVSGQWDEQVGYFSIRKFLQKYATDIVRERFDEDYWIRRALLNTFTVEASLDGHRTQKIVVTDVRFQNEIDYIRAQGGLIVYIDREGYGGKIKKHKSELLANDSSIRQKADLTINNLGTLKDLEKEVLTLSKTLSEKEHENSIYPAN